eukprot:8605561-Prorocentrum_lima.AAC.1
MLPLLVLVSCPMVVVFLGTSSDDRLAISLRRRHDEALEDPGFRFGIGCKNGKAFCSPATLLWWKYQSTNRSTTKFRL